jgi:hypothetical protein
MLIAALPKRIELAHYHREQDPSIKRLKLPGAAIQVFRASKFLKAAPAA